MKELEDLPGFPKFLRNAQTAYIGFVVAKFGIYNPLTDWLNQAEIQSKHMFDLCSGSGEPAAGIFKRSQLFSSLTLSDKFPPGGYAESIDIRYPDTPLDVNEMDFREHICYTMFNALHHLNDDEKTTLIHKIIRSRSEAVFAEILQPQPGSLIKVLMATTLGVIVLSPFVRPLKFSTLFFTYVIPINILSITFDGIVSVFKSNTENQYRKLFKDLGNKVEVLRIGSLLAPLVIIRIKSQ